MDFTSILNAQTHFLSTLTSLFPTANTEMVGNSLSGLNTQLNQLNTDLNTNKTSEITSRQADMQRIVDAETNRLHQKQGSIDQAMASQKRLIDLNQSYSEKYNQYIFIIIIFVVALVLFLGITLVQQNMEILSEGVFMILSIIIFGGAFIYAIIIYNNIQARSNMNYAELAVATPTKLTPAEIAAQNAKNVDAGQLLASQNLSNCAGSTCCGDTTHWDASMQVCVTGKESFTTIADSGNTILGNYNKQTSDTIAYSDNEFDVYALYK